MPKTVPPKQAFVGTLVGGIAASVLKDVIGNAVDRLTRDPDMPVTRDKADAIVREIVKEVVPAVTKEIAPKAAEQVQKIETNATNSEPWYKSRVIWGAGVSLAMTLLQLAGVQLDMVRADEIVSVGLQTVAAVSALFALYGRIFGARLKPLGE